VIIESGTSRVVGTTTEEIALVEAEGLPALRRTQVLESDELGNRRAETIVFRDGFLPHSHLDCAEAWTLSIRYQGTAIVGEKHMATGAVVPIRAEVDFLVFDAHSVEMVLRILPLAEGYVVEIPVFHAGRGRQMLVTACVVGRETMAISGHPVDAWKVKTVWDRVTQYYWIGVENRHLLRQLSELSEEVQLEFAR
jgi:hypothetical protein